MLYNGRSSEAKTKPIYIYMNMNMKTFLIAIPLQRTENIRPIYLLFPDFVFHYCSVNLTPIEILSVLNGLDFIVMLFDYVNFYF